MTECRWRGTESENNTRRATMSLDEGSTIQRYKTLLKVSSVLKGSNGVLEWITYSKIQKLTLSRCLSRQWKTFCVYHLKQRVSRCSKWKLVEKFKVQPSTEESVAHCNCYASACECYIKQPRIFINFKS